MTLSCATRSIITWLIYLLRVFSPNRLGRIPSEVIQGCILRSKHLPHHAFRAHFFTERVIPIWNHLPHDVVTSLNITVFRTQLDLLTYHPFVCYIPSMFRQFVSACTHRATTCLFVYACVFICMQSIKSINQIS